MTNIEIDWSKVDLSTIDLQSLLDKNNYDYNQMSGLLDRIESGESSLNYEEQEHYAEKLRDEIYANRAMNDILQRAISVKDVTNGL